MDEAGATPQSRDPSSKMMIEATNTLQNTYMSRCFWHYCHNFAPFGRPHNGILSKRKDERRLREDKALKNPGNLVQGLETTSNDGSSSCDDSLPRD